MQLDQTEVRKQWARDNWRRMREYLSHERDAIASSPMFYKATFHPDVLEVWNELDTAYWSGAMHLGLPGGYDEVEHAEVWHYLGAERERTLARVSGGFTRHNLYGYSTPDNTSTMSWMV